MVEKIIGIGATSKLSGLSERTLRYWESLGLIQPIRLPSGHRKFSISMVKKIISIRHNIEKHNLRINDLITSSTFLNDDTLKDKVATAGVFDLNINLDTPVYELAKKNGRIHPLSGLPDKIFIQQEIIRKLDSNAKLSVCYIDLKDFRLYNKRYGYEKGDAVLKFLAAVIYDVVKEYGAVNDIAGHYGGDNFVIITDHDRHMQICSELIKNFDHLIGQHYDKADKVNGYIVTKKRNTEEEKTAIMTLSISVVWNAKRKLSHFAQVEDLATELKLHAQKMTKSELIVDRRTY
ncbi:MAG: diguanylate cyclase [bacterium]